ncbi:MAG: TIGR03986 family CRISPR-associated RAMP protein [Gammaproteobacteria bacterium]|nr:TIGR03986 family CRISPR-associated RAMP protein [Gammaproteobacteria bacterium]
MYKSKIVKTGPHGAYGFLLNPMGKNRQIFVHKTDVEGQPELKEGMILEYDLLDQGAKGHKAVRAKVLTASPPAQAAPVPARSENRYKTPANRGKPVIKKVTKKTLSPNSPYHFVPIPKKEDGMPDSLMETPVLHDGSGEAEKRHSGEILCSLTALTPLLVANDQYEVKAAKAKKAFQGVSAEKKILEPLRLLENGKPGRVVIPGTALKGMLRQSISALLAAPMERVAERTYSYRPNVAFGKGRSKKRECRPAVITGIDRQNNTLTLKVLPNAQDTVFVRDSAFRKMDVFYQGKHTDKLNGGKEISGECSGIGYDTFRGRTNEQRIVDNSGSLALNHIYFTYLGGIDGSGHLAAAHKVNEDKSRGRNLSFARANPDKQIYRHVLVDIDTWEQAVEYSVSSELYTQHQQTQEHLYSQKDGHLSNHPLNSVDGLDIDKVAKNIEKHAEVLNENQLIYVEVEEENGRIVSFGRHFRYRWRYTDTVRTRWNPQAPENSETRSILSPLPEEQHPQPQKLSGARLLFGYVSGGADDQEKGVEKIGKENFSRFAGRLAFNMGIEMLNDKKPDDNSRFLKPKQDNMVELKILGMPRPSAVEFYLDQADISQRQDGGSLVTYGDIAGETSGELNGRKFYLHQPDAATDESCYIESDAKIVQGNQAPFSRFVSAPNTRFRFALRFRDLRDWELGALLMVLEPARLLEQQTALSEDCVNSFKLAAKPDLAKLPMFAHKLGHARPLGFGSVEIRIDKLRCWKTDDTQRESKWEAAPAEGKKQEEAEAFLKRAQQAYFDKHKAKKVLLHWLEVHRYRGRTRISYPNVTDRRGNCSIYNFHTARRLQHANGRREAGKPQADAEALQPLSTSC